MSEWITFLALSPPAERAALISRELQARPLSEVDVWLPERFTDELRTMNLEEPTLYVEAWLEWAEALGRKDALFLAAGLGLGRLSLRGESRSLLETASRWAGLPPRTMPHGEEQGHIPICRPALRSGRKRECSRLLRSARKLFEDVGDRRGLGNTFVGEGLILYRLGENEKALAALQNARKLFEQVGDRGGQGNTFISEADILLVWGEREALDTYKRARKLYGDAGDRRGQGKALEVRRMPCLS